MSSNFIIDSTLEHDSFLITKLKLCQVRLVNNSDYYWLILVPEINDIVEITDLDNAEYGVLCSEVRQISEVMQRLFKPDKLNIANIGNIVSQLHVHIIARFKNDKLFPKPVWGAIPVHYDPYALQSKIALLAEAIESW